MKQGKPLIAVELDVLTQFPYNSQITHVISEVNIIIVLFGSGFRCTFIDNNK